MLIYLAPAISNVIWGAGGIVAKLGIVDANPLLFLLIRAGIAGPFLSAVAFIIHRELPAPAFWPRTLLGGVTVFFDQCFYIVGIKISSGTTSALWQPTQPIFACALAIVIGMERFSLLKVIGIVVGAAGAMFASVYGVEDSGVSSERLLYGSLCFFINCSGAAMYAIVAKRLLELSKYSTLSVLGWSYTVAAALSAAITTACGSSPAARVCLVASRQAASCIWSHSYFLVMNSMLAYGLNARAVRHAPPSVVTNFCVLQPVVAIALSLVLLSIDH